MRILIVDSSALARRQLQRDLAGRVVVEAISAAAGLACLLAATVDVCLVHWDLPGMDGLAFVNTVRTEPAYQGCAQTKIVVMSHRTAMGDVQAALAAGASDYLMQPFTREAVLAKLDRLAAP